MKISWLILGILSIIAGIIALMNPGVASLTAEMLAAWFFLILGIFQIIAAFSQRGWGATLWVLFLGVIGVAAGMMLLNKPLQGLIALTWALGILFFISGLIKVMYSFQLRGSGLFGAVLISGILSLILSFIIISNFPASAAAALGILLAVELISNGIALIGFSSVAKKIESSQAAA